MKKSKKSTEEQKYQKRKNLELVLKLLIEVIRLLCDLFG
jgi:hypothetical protein